jgi:hypothetical protein
MFKLKMNNEAGRDMLMASVYRGSVGKSKLHRLSTRPWQEPVFEQLPDVLHQSRNQRRDDCRQGLDSKVQFSKHLHFSYGHDVRGWRRGLAQDGSFVLPLEGLRRYCKHVGLAIDVPSLCNVLDQDRDGRVTFAEVCPVSAARLASFKKWSCEHFGSCGALWDQCVVADNDDDDDGDGVGDNHTRVPIGILADANVIKELVWQRGVTGLVDSWIRDVAARTALFSSLDLHGNGFIERADLEWIDRWVPPEYLAIQPDPSAWDELRSRLLAAYKHPIQAWRVLFDKNDSNYVTWSVFKKVCKQVQFAGNVGGAWVTLDSGLTGNISMMEFDAEAGQILRSFRDWAYEHFGSVDATLKYLDLDRKGSVTSSQLRRACSKLNWSGDVRAFLDCFGVGKAIHAADLVFLDSWQFRHTAEELANCLALTVATEVTRPVLLSTPAAPYRSPTLPSMMKTCSEPMPQAKGYVGNFVSRSAKKEIRKGPPQENRVVMARRTSLPTLLGQPRFGLGPPGVDLLRSRSR